MKKIIILPSIILIFAVAIFWFGPGLRTYWQIHTAPYSHKWFAIYLQNDQSLFARIKGFTRTTIELSDVYYIQTFQVSSSTTSNLVRRGTNEISAPKNYLFVNRSQILYWEEIGENATVMNIIKWGQ